LVHAQCQRLRVIDVQLQGNLFEVENDVGRVLDDSRNRRELVEHAVDFDGRYCSAFNRRKQDAPQGVAHRRSETPLERLRVKTPESIGQRLTLEFQSLWPLKAFPQHHDVLSPNGPADGPPDLQVWSPASRRRSV